MSMIKNDFPELWKIFHDSDSDSVPDPDPFQFYLNWNTFCAITIIFLLSWSALIYCYG